LKDSYNYDLDAILS
jgi:mannosyl-oligosaccharide glucosidase